MFKLKKKSIKSQARLGLLKTRHGLVETPVFMPIATQGAIKNLTTLEMQKLKAPIILGNAYHLFFKPGLEILKKAKGLHNFINWPKAVLTDSGGFQVFSLANKLQGHHASINRKPLVRITEKGVHFQSVYDGSWHLFTPEKVLQIQKIIGSDIRMVLDICSPSKCSKIQAKKDLEITLNWAKAARLKKANDGSLLFGIVQGALYKDLRIKCVNELKKIDKDFSAKGARLPKRSGRQVPASGWDGYAVGGLAVGESPKEMYKVLDYTVRELPEDKPRYLMGVGYPEQIVEAVRRGIDMFDCVIPTREARHGRLYFFKNNNPISTAYYTETLTNKKYKNDFKPINSESALPELREYSKAYLRHLFSVNEPLSMRLASLNNIEFYLKFIERIRLNIKQGKL